MPQSTTLSAREKEDLRELQLELRQLHRESILLTLPAIYMAGLLLLVSTRWLPDPLQGGLPGAFLFWLPPLVIALRQVNYLAAVWVMVVGCIATLLGLVWQVNLTFLLPLVALPIGLVTLFVSLPAGLVGGALCTYLLLGWPAFTTQIDLATRLVTVTQIWGVIWLVWLTSRPLMTAIEWSWRSYRRSYQLLEDTRNYQLKLNQTLADLAEANLQLTRLNRLAAAMRRRAEEARLAKEQFVANVSHELRTPLNLIIGFIEVIMQAPHTYGRAIPQGLLADLAIVLRNSRHLSSLIDDVLDLSQIETGQVALTKEQTDLRKIIEAAVTAVQPLYKSKGLYLNTVYADDLPKVHCDKTRIRQVVLNLLSNAGRFTEKGGVTVRTWSEHDYVIVSVSDTGPGLDKGEQEKVFEPFRQLDGSTARRQGGSGLGLSISRSFVELHEGKMWVESEKGQGTTFYFRLPIGVNPLQASDVRRWFSPYGTYNERTRPPSLPAVTDRPRLLVYERGHVLQRILTRYLNFAEIVPVASVEEALAELEQTPAQAILVNELSVSEGLDRLEARLTLPFGLPVILCAIPDVQETASQLGVVDYLVKPVSRDTLLGALKRVPRPVTTILVVDDDHEALRLFRRMLTTTETGTSYRVLRATDGQQALHLMRDVRPDLVLIDLIMPNMDGFQLLRAMRQDPELNDIPTIVISAQDPAGQPIVSKSMAVIRGGGISVHRLLRTIEALINTLSLQQVDLSIQGSEKSTAAQGLAEEGSRP